MRARIAFLGTILALALGAAACGGGSTSSATPPSTTPPYPYAGSWTGTRTGSSSAVRFTVAGDRLTAFTMEASLVTFDGRTFRSCSYTMSLAEHVTLSGGGFTARLASSWGTTSVRGTFTSSTAASGSFDAYATPAGSCGGAPAIADTQAAGSWTATRQ